MLLPHLPPRTHSLLIPSSQRTGFFYSRIWFPGGLPGLLEEDGLSGRMLIQGFTERGEIDGKAQVKSKSSVWFLTVVCFVFSNRQKLESSDKKP